MFKIKRIAVLLIGFVFIWSLDGPCKETAQPVKEGAVANQPNEEKKGPPTVLVKVNGETIDELDLLGMVNALIPGASVHGSTTEKKQKEIKKKAFEQLITDELLFQESKKQGIKVTKREIQKEIKEIKKRLKKNKATLVDTLNKSKITMEQLEKGIEKKLSINKIKDIKNKEIAALAGTKVTDEYLEEHYNKNKESFMVPEAIRLREILIRADPSGGQQGWDESKTRAGNIMKEIKAGRDFAELAKEFSQDIYASKGGDMGLGHKGSIIPEIENMANKLQIGEVAGPIWSIYGYHIIKLEEKIPPVQMKFDEVKKHLKGEQIDAQTSLMKGEWVEELNKKAKIEYMNEEDRVLMMVKEQKDVKEEKQDENKENK